MAVRSCVALELRGDLKMGFLTSPDLQKFPLDFATKHVDLTWGDILWGYEHDLFAWYDVIELAQMRVKDTIDFEEYDLVSSLSSVDKSCVWKVSDVLKKLAERSITDDESSKKSSYISVLLGVMQVGINMITL